MRTCRFFNVSGSRVWIVCMGAADVFGISGDVKCVMPAASRRRPFGADIQTSLHVRCSLPPTRHEYAHEVRVPPSVHV